MAAEEGLRGMPQVAVTVSRAQLATGLLSTGDRRDGRPPVSVQQAVQQIIDNYFLQPTDGAGGSIG